MCAWLYVNQRTIETNSKYEKRYVWELKLVRTNKNYLLRRHF